MGLDYLNFNLNNSNNITNINNNLSNINNNLKVNSNLVDPKIKDFFNKTLRKCHNFKNQHDTLISNIIYLFIFIFVIGLILLFKYKGKKNSYEKKIKDRKEKEYILAKLIHINKMNDKEKQNSLGLITDLPAINDIVNQNINYNSFRKEIFQNY